MTPREILQKFRNISTRRSTDEANALSNKEINKKDTTENFEIIIKNMNVRKKDYERKTNELSLINEANNLLVLAIFTYLLIIIPWEYAIFVSQIISSVSLSRAVSIWNMKESKPGEEDRWDHLWWILIPFAPFVISIYYHLTYYKKGKKAITFRYPNSLQPDKVTNLLKSSRNDKDKKLIDADNKYNETIRDARTAYSNSLPGLKRGIDEIKTNSGYTGASWDDSSWNNWARWNSSLLKFWKPDSRVAPFVRIGNLKEHGKWDNLEMPAFIPLIGGSNLILKTSGRGKDPGIKGIKSLMLRMLALVPPGKLRFILIDPEGGGGNLAEFMRLKDFHEALVGSRVWTAQRDIENQLEILRNQMEYRIQRLLADNSTTIEQYNANAGDIGQPYIMLVVINYPVNFFNSSAGHLKNIALNGPRSGIYTLMTVDIEKLQEEMSNNSSLEEIEDKANVIFWDNNEGHFIWDDNDFKNCILNLDMAPWRELFDLILDQVGAQAKEASKIEVPFKKIIPPKEDWWKGNTIKGLKVPIGIKVEGGYQYFELGKEMEHHALLVGTTGSGKSNLLNVLITSLGLIYSSSELELYLIDFKEGMEFKPYVEHEMPHARVVAIESERESGLSVIEEVHAEMERRGVIFRENGDNNISTYRQRTGKQMPRILLIVDEFQKFFSFDDTIALNAQRIFDDLVRLGRASGIHVLLSSQTLAGTTLLRTAISQMAVRIALQCSDADSRLILAEENPAARHLERPGEAIYNDDAGKVDNNNNFQVAALFSKEIRKFYLNKIQNKAQKENYIPTRKQIVFEGYALSEQKKNTMLNDLLMNFPQKTISKKVSIWLGEPITIKEPTNAKFNRSRGNNMIIMGDNHETAAGMLLSSFIALATQYTQKKVRFYIVDLYSMITNYSNLFTRLSDCMPHPVQIIEKQNLYSFINKISKKVNERIEGETGDYGNHSSIYIMIFGLQRARDLNDDQNFYSSSDEEHVNPTQQFTSIVKEGPDVGVHTLVWCDSYRNFTDRVGRKLLEEFDLRVAMQMSESDSDNFITSSAAGNLGSYRAYYYSKQEGSNLEKFQPYGLPSEEWLEWVEQQFAKIDIKAWKEDSDVIAESVNVESGTVEHIPEIENPQVINGNTVRELNSEDTLEPLMFCPDHGKITIGYLEIIASRPVLYCNICNKTFEIKTEKFVFDTNILISRLFSDLSKTGFFDNKSILIPETVNDEINHWKNVEENREIYNIAKDEIQKIRNANDQRKLIYGIIGKEASYAELIEKGRPDKIIVKDAEKENAIVITSDKDFLLLKPEVSVIIYRYLPPMVGENINVSIIGESNGDGVGHYKKYTIFIANTGNMIGQNVNAEIEKVFSSKRVATANLIK